MNSTREDASLRIQNVWNFVGGKLRQVRSQLDAIVDEFYDFTDRYIYLNSVQKAMDAIIDLKKCPRFHNLSSIRKVLKFSHPINMKQRKNMNAIQSFVTKIDSSMKKLKVLERVVSNDVLKPLEKYCSRYTSLGVEDDIFFKRLTGRTKYASTILDNFQTVISSVVSELGVESVYFSTCGFSEEIASILNCKLFPVLRVFPDLVQKLEMIYDISQDWLRSDKVYVQQVKTKLLKTQIEIKQTETKYQATKVKQKTLTDQIMKNTLENAENLDKLKASKNVPCRVKIKIPNAKIRTFKNSCLKLASNKNDDPDGCSPPSDTEEEELDEIHQVSRFPPIVSKQDHNSRLSQVLKEQEHRNRLIEDIETNNCHLHKLSKKLRTNGKRKGTLDTKLQILRKKLKFLDNVLQEKTHISCSRSAKAKKREQFNLNFQETSLPESRDSNCSSNETGKHSAELQKAFNLIKNQIGLGWKELTRALPNKPRKRLNQIDSEISAIEYKYPGQLGEQAYQAMLKWYNYNGEDTSVDELCQTLRDINENRLADSVRKLIRTRPID